MANLMKLEFIALDISRKKYLSWFLDVEINLEAMSFGDSIKKGSVASHRVAQQELYF